MTQAAQLLAHLPTRDHRMAELEQMVVEHLHGDWVVRIEHTPRVMDYHDGWKQWGKALFPVGDPARVIDAISGCRNRHPAHTIRLCAEKLRPQARLVLRV